MHTHGSPEQQARQDMARSISSAQTEVHTDLDARVRRHMDHPSRRPIAAHTQAAFDAVEAWRAAHGQDRPVVLDAGCGVGESTAHWARVHPEHLVIGVDKSAARLERGTQDHVGDLPAHATVVRADLLDFWRLVVRAKWPVSHHYVLFPNPYPKIGQLKNRWHGSAAFPALVGVGGLLHMRSNWDVYIAEAAQALGHYGITAQTSPYVPSPPITPFERKYHAAGQTLWQLHADTRAAR